MSDLKGIISPFTTPFSENGEIDYSLVKPQVDWLIDNGVHGLAAGGSTGEGHVLDREEYIKLMKTTVDSVDGRIPVVAGIVTNSTSEVIARGNLVKDLKDATPSEAADYLLQREEAFAPKTKEEMLENLSGQSLKYKVNQTKQRNELTQFKCLKAKHQTNL